VLTDTREEQIHQRFKQSHYSAQVLDEAAHVETIDLNEESKGDKFKAEHIP
jgi:hypothetical protein